MIVGKPRVRDCDGQRHLVDANRDVLVCRQVSPYTHGCYHQVDCPHYDQTGEVRPRCHVISGQDEQWQLKRRVDLARTWDRCQYERCYGDEGTTTDTGPQLAAALRDMSIAEFEAAVADHRSVQTDGGQA